jgi:hypothetical protein
MRSRRLSQCGPGGRFCQFNQPPARFLPRAQAKIALAIGTLRTGFRPKQSTEAAVREIRGPK